MKKSNTPSPKSIDNENVKKRAVKKGEINSRKGVDTTKDSLRWQMLSDLAKSQKATAEDQLKLIQSLRKELNYYKNGDKRSCNSCLDASICPFYKADRIVEKLTACLHMKIKKRYVFKSHDLCDVAEKMNVN